MELLHDVREKQKTQISYFGKIAPSAEVQQATVEGHYELRVTI
jgi:hypothetical protein